MSTRPRAIVAVLACTLPACTSAPRPATVHALPVPLVAALISQQGGSASRPARVFTVDTLPDGFPANLLPPGPVRVVGGMKAGGEIVAVLADSTRRLSAVLEDHFPSVGFNRPGATPGAGFSRGSGPYAFFCNDSATVRSEPLTGQERHLTRVTYVYDPRGRSGCPANRAAAAPTVPARGEKATLRLPELKAPAGFRVQAAGGGGNDDEVNSAAEISGAAIVPRVILDHYASQLVAARWIGVAPAVAERVAAQMFEAKDTAGATWHGVLTVHGSGSSGWLTLTMTRIPSR